jgi:hypothetical protein
MCKFTNNISLSLFYTKKRDEPRAKSTKYLSCYTYFELNAMGGSRHAAIGSPNIYIQNIRHPIESFAIGHGNRQFRNMDSMLIPYNLKTPFAIHDASKIRKVSFGQHGNGIGSSPFSAFFVSIRDIAITPIFTFFLPRFHGEILYAQNILYAIDNHPNCLHLWRQQSGFPLPPSILVGDKSKGILTAKEAAELWASK